jgi:hypothetical protein
MVPIVKEGQAFLFIPYSARNSSHIVKHQISDLVNTSVDTESLIFFPYDNQTQCYHVGNLGGHLSTL